MAGYSGWSKSNNAIRAEDDGLMVASKLAAWARQWRRYAGCTAADVAQVLSPDEWHHTSKRYNRTNYYNPCDLGETDVRSALAAEIANRKRWATLRREADRRGLEYFVTETGRQWYLIPKKWRRGEAFPANEIDLAHLESLLAD